jgi:Flp pilus assembly protein TadG
LLRPLRENVHFNSFDQFEIAKKKSHRPGKFNSWCLHQIVSFSLGSLAEATISKACTMWTLFRKNQSGAVALLFAFAAIPILLVAGAAVDVSRSVSAQTKLQTALDAGALAAAASDLPEADRIALAEKTFHQNVGPDYAGATPNFFIGTDAVTADVDITVSNVFMKFAGVSQTNVAADSVVQLPRDKPAEVVLVLDYSSSMNSNGKWQAMRDAALDLVDTLSEQQTNDQVKFALVPFAKMVVADLPADYVIDEDTNTPWTGSGCTQDRKWPYNTQDTTPDQFNNDTKWGAVGQADGTCFQMSSHNLEHFEVIWSRFGIPKSPIE